MTTDRPTDKLVSAPTLESERLLLTAHRLSDFDDCAAMWGDAEVTRYIGGRPSTREEVWARIHRYAGHWTLLGYGYWVVREKATGRFAGEIGFADFKRDMTPSLEGKPEGGWVLAPWAHGKGFATEALRRALAWTDANLAGQPTACLIGPQNLASIRVAEKCGYREFARTTYKGDAGVLFERQPVIVR